MAKMTEAEIQAAGRNVREIARRNGYDEGRKFANMLEEEMISRQNTSHDDIRAFEEATGYLWECPSPSSFSKLDLFILVFLLVMYVLAIITDRKKSNHNPVTSGNSKKIIL